MQLQIQLHPDPPSYTLTTSNYTTHVYNACWKFITSHYTQSKVAWVGTQFGSGKNLPKYIMISRHLLLPVLLLFFFWFLTIFECCTAVFIDKTGWIIKLNCIPKKDLTCEPSYDPFLLITESWVLRIQGFKNLSWIYFKLSSLLIVFVNISISVKLYSSVTKSLPAANPSWILTMSITSRFFFWILKIRGRKNLFFSLILLRFDFFVD